MTRNKQTTIAETKRLGSLITSSDLGPVSLESAIEVTVTEVVRRARVDLLFELHQECVDAGRLNAARWLLEKSIVEFSEGRAERDEEMGLAEILAFGEKVEC